MESQTKVRRTGMALGSCLGDPCSNPLCSIAPLFLVELKHGVPLYKIYNTLHGKSNNAVA